MRSSEALISLQFHVTNLRLMQQGDAPLELQTSRASRMLVPLEIAAEAIATHAGRPGWEHATAVLGEAYWLTLRAGDRSALPVLGTHLATALAGRGPTLETIAGLQQEERVLLHVYGALTKVKSGAQTLKLLEHKIDQCGVSRFAARIAHDDPLETVEEIAREGDPTAWSQTFPDVFADTYLIDDPTQCRDRYADPTPSSRVRKLGDPFNGVLFEDARFGGVLSLRNLLKLIFTVTGGGPKGTVTIEYGLYEALSNAVPGSAPQAGGLDVDRSSDPSDKNSVAKCQVTLDSGHIETTAAKQVRFSDDAVFSAELNAMALPLLTIWITGLLLQSAQL